MVTEYRRVRLKLTEDLAKCESAFEHAVCNTSAERMWYRRAVEAFTKVRLWDVVHENHDLPSDDLLVCNEHWHKIRMEEDMKWEKMRQNSKESEDS